MYLEIVRQDLLKEAQASPNLLSDLAGLENYIAESYHDRSFIELLQNADDAQATKFMVHKDGNVLFVANNGREFNQKDLESLCRSASSNKLRGESIGYRGIGFKSVVSFTKEIHIISGELELTFSKELTQKEIPLALRVPLIRLPHQITDRIKGAHVSSIEKLKSEGYSTIFIFTDVTASQIESEFHSFNYNSLLFLKNVAYTEISLSDTNITEIKKSLLAENILGLEMVTNGDLSKWHISNFNTSSIAFSINNDEIIKLPYNSAVVHAFLPTENTTGFGVLINGNYSTDPSRRHLIYDQLTIDAIETCITHLLKIFTESLDKLEDFNLIKSLIPFSDPRMLQFSKNSFEKLV